MATNCDCHEKNPACGLDLQSNSDKCFAGDVAATIDFGFESIKLDSCGVQRNITHYSMLFNQTGKAVMIEDCHNGNPVSAYRNEDTSKVVCPMNFFRTSADINPSKVGTASTTI